MLIYSIDVIVGYFSREIAAECDHQCSDRTRHVQSRRDDVISALNRAIGFFNSSKLPQHDASRDRTVTSVNRSRNSLMPEPPAPAPRISDAAMDETNGEDGVIDFFLEVALHVPTTESAAAMLALLKTFTDLNEFHQTKCGAFLF